MKHAQLIAVQIGDRELAQVPRLVFRLGDDLRASVAPTVEQFVHFLLAIEVQPDYDRSRVAVVLAERRIRKKYAALAFRNASDAALVVTPIKLEAERIDVILSGPLDVAYGDLWNGLRKVRKHVLEVTPISSKRKRPPNPKRKTPSKLSKEEGLLFEGVAI